MILILCISLGGACGEGDDEVRAAAEAYCNQGCNYFYFSDIDACIAVMAAQQRCTNCPEMHAERLSCVAQYDCDPGPDDCALPSGCRYVAPDLDGNCSP